MDNKPYSASKTVFKEYVSYIIASFFVTKASLLLLLQLSLPKIPSVNITLVQSFHKKNLILRGSLNF